jgi:micrococcal nuclease
MIKIAVSVSFMFFISFVKISAFQNAKVVYVIDGDTVVLKINGEKQSVRLIGIDCPESNENKRAKRIAKKSKIDIKTINHFGKRATDHTKKLLPKNKEVYIEYDVIKKDKYNRTLAYVFLDNFGDEMINEQILKDGYAEILIIPPNIRYKQRFIRALNFAKKYKEGLWRM